MKEEDDEVLECSLRNSETMTLLIMEWEMLPAIAFEEHDLAISPTLNPWAAMAQILQYVPGNLGLGY